MLMLVTVLASLAGTGCYRASTVQRAPMVAEVLPETGGDRVKGLKSKSGSGDYYLGNDFIQVGIDSTVYGDSVRIPLAGAPSGGGIVDAGYIALDGSYNRVSVPGDALNRITPVVNQDPTLQMVFSGYSLTAGDNAGITMTGAILDPNNRLGTGAGSGPVTGLSVVHTLTLAQLDRFITMTTTVTNNTSSALPIYSIGDALTQKGGGYHFIAPANVNYQGVALATPWGVQIPATSDLTSNYTASAAGPASVPRIATSVQAPMVGLIDSEPGANTVDSHASLGFLPVQADRLLVASDPQDLLTLSPASASMRPAFPSRLVVGSLPAASPLAAGASLTFTRRLYILGGGSAATNIVGGLRLPANYANMGTGLFNLMDVARYTDTNIRTAQDVGTVTFTLSGASQRQGPLPTEIRIDRNVTPELATATWQTQRVEMFEPNENIVTTTALAPSTLRVLLPVGVYRIVLRNQNHSQIRTTFEDTNDPDRVNMAGPIWIQKDRDYVVSAQDVLDPEAATLAGNANLETSAVTSAPYSTHYFVTREANGPTGSLQPLRITLVGAGSSADPVMRRQRTLGGDFAPSLDAPGIASPGIAGQFQFRAGNELFGTGFSRYVSSEFAWLLNGSSYTAYASRGPLFDLYSLPLKAYDGQTDTTHTFTVFPQGMPSGWVSFDMPGPSQATTGFYLPGEKLASAMANGIQVVGDTEQDQLVDAPTLYTDFTNEFLTQTTYQRPYGLGDITRSNPSFSPEPFVVGARTSDLAGYGTVSALFTPVATATRLGGAQDSSSWTLADFLAQAQGSFNVVHRPRKPTTGLFNLFTPLPTAAWWSQTGLMSMGLANGNFDALELLRGESLDAADPSAWFTEFKQVRADWFGLLNYQSPTFFTKALGLSSAQYSLDTPVGLARTYLKATPLVETDLSGILSALRSGAAVASTGPLLDVSIGTAGPGGLVAGPLENVTLTVNLWTAPPPAGGTAPWMPVDELRVFVNGNPVKVISLPITGANPVLTQSGTDSRLYTGTITLTKAQLQPTAGKDAWVVVQAGVADTQTGAYQLGTPWNLTMRGIYPIAVTNPIFVNVTGGAYKPPSL